MSACQRVEQFYLVVVPLDADEHMATLKYIDHRSERSDE